MRIRSFFPNQTLMQSSRIDGQGSQSRVIERRSSKMNSRMISRRTILSFCRVAIKQERDMEQDSPKLR